MDGFGLAGAWLTEALNTNSHTFEVTGDGPAHAILVRYTKMECCKPRFCSKVAPMFIVAERAVLRYIMHRFGFDPETGDGIFAPGGSMANM